jgi:AcrR family transcriptional regulator
VLAAAEKLVADNGAAALRIAGVGAGAVYRVFGDKRGLLIALVDERERDLQSPSSAVPRRSAPAHRPRSACARSCRRCSSSSSHNARCSWSPTRAPPSRVTTPGRIRPGGRHVAHLLAQMQLDGDPDVLAEMLLAPLAAGVQVHLIDERGVEPQVIARALDVLLEGLGAASGTSRR